MCVRKNETAGLMLSRDTDLCVCAVVKNSSMESSEQKKTRVKLKKFLTRRPTLQAVRDKGYIKGNIQQN